MAETTDDLLPKTVLRVVGQAIGTGHMKEYAMVAADYAVKVVNLLCPGDRTAVIAERNWQITSLNQVLLSPSL